MLDTLSKPVLFVLIFIGALLLSFIIFIWIISPAPSERTETVFVYATLTNPLIRTIMCQCVTELTPATLNGYEQINRSIIHNQQATVSGGLIAVTPAELRRLDRYERVPTRYTRQRVTIEDEAVWVYIKNQ